MQLTKDMDLSLRSRTKAMVGHLCGVGLVVESIVGDIFLNIKVENIILTVLRRHR